MSAQGYENDALTAFNSGYHKKAVRLLREGANISLGRGRSGRMEDWADIIEFNYKNIEGVVLESFFDIDRRDEFKAIIDLEEA